MTLLYGQQIPAGLGFSTIIADMDFETYSKAGFIWNEITQSYVTPKGATKRGIFAVGAVAYAQHPSTEVLLLAYDLKDGLGKRQWIPGLPNPVDLFEHMAFGKLIEAWNCNFELWIWAYVCTRLYDWPMIDYRQMRDAMAKSRANAYPGALANAGKVSGAPFQKLESGTNLINFFSCPRKPTKNRPEHRNMPADYPKKFQQYCDYNLGDIEAEASVSAMCPDLSESEQEFELYTRLMNIRGVAVDLVTVRAACNILDQMYEQYDAELYELTGRTVNRASERDKLIAWLSVAHGIVTKSLDKDHIDALLARTDLPAPARRALEIRQLTGSAGVKKYYAIDRMASQAGRLHDLIVYHAARTGRDAGQDVQPQNLVKQGPELMVCESCGHVYGPHLHVCPWCAASAELAHKIKWDAKTPEHVEDIVVVIRQGRLDQLEYIYGDAALTLSGCLRGMFVAGPGMDLICSDFSSIEAVITAVIAGEQWRIEAFQRKEDIYLHSASRTTGISFETYKQYAIDNGHKHPDRGKIGKPQELGLGFGGWIGAWNKFDNSDTFTDDEKKKNILAWWEASPAIVELWGGQLRGKPWAPDYYERYGLEGAVINAIEYPGRCFESHGITYGVKDDVLYCRLISGRFITYHKPRLRPSERWPEARILAASYEGWNSSPDNGPIGWLRMDLKRTNIVENVVQAIAADILRYAVINLEKAGYPVVMRVHDEVVCEVPEGTGSIEEVEAIMGTMPPWAKDWPIRAAGGWRGKRYRKD